MKNFIKRYTFFVLSAFIALGTPRVSNAAAQTKNSVTYIVLDLHDFLIKARKVAQGALFVATKFEGWTDKDMKAVADIIGKKGKANSEATIFAVRQATGSPCA